MTDGPVYTWRGVLASLLLAVGFYGFFFAVVAIAAEAGLL